jgi:hypothetical protein
MLGINVRTMKDRRLGTVVIAVVCGSLLATLCLAVAQTSIPRTCDAGQKKVALRETNAETRLLPVR